MEAAAQAAEIAFEKYNGARWALHKAKVETRRARAASVKAAADVETERAAIVQLVTESYQNGTELNTATALMSGEGPQGLMNRYGVVQSAGDSMQAAYERFKVASAQGEGVRRQGGQGGGEAEGARRRGQGARPSPPGRPPPTPARSPTRSRPRSSSWSQALAKAEDISIDLAKERADALEEIARQKRRRGPAGQGGGAPGRAEEAGGGGSEEGQAGQEEPAQGDRRRRRRWQPCLPPVTAAPVPVADPAPNQSIAVPRTIAYAKAQLGKPYQWAAAGPKTFDCSGLTMQAWARGGKRLPHYSVAQFAQSTPISMLDARAGDLLFWSSNGSPSGIHHVALYLGGGQFIEAPHTGAVVRYNSIYNWYPDFVARP